ncbi:porin [Xanthobacter sp. DSM 24535]|uniref:porin n=1 Tax=Roseixanthobacter psychrophilus TaxID=3119917 RepID=UPI00372701AC
MKMVKSLLLGSAAGLVAVAGANAADLPVKAKAVEYVKVCSAYGAGYYYVPGTDTCLKIGGYARVDYYYNGVGTFNPAISNVAGGAFSNPGTGSIAYPFQTDRSSDYRTRVRGTFDFDARTATDYGVLRSYVRGGVEWNSWGASGASATPSNGGNNLYVERVFIQFAGFTFGYTQSFFDTGIDYMMTTPYAGSNQWNTVVAYTAQFGNGFSASLALEDAANRITGVQGSVSTVLPTTLAGLASGVASPGLPLGYVSPGYTNYQAGTQVPDIVANLRVDQAWGSAQLSGALHQVTALTPLNTGVFPTGVSYLGQSTDDTWGWAIGGSVELKLPVISPGDSLYIQANYADGALSYLGLSGTTQGRATSLGSSGINSFGSFASYDGAFYPLADAVWNGSNLSYDTESGWALQGQYRHYWMPNLRSAVYAGYVDISVPDNTVGAADVKMWQVGLNTIWSPVKNLDLGVEVLYSKVEGGNNLLANNTTAYLTPSLATGVVTSAVGGSTDVWSGGFRAQRNF